MRDATTAPSLHNAQPWAFVFRPADDVLELHADPGRDLPYADPNGRALHISCGAALFTLRVAIAHRGREPEVLLLPDPARPGLLAVVRMLRTPHADADLDGLYPAVHRRHTSRHPFADTRVPQEVWDALTEAARAEGAELVVPGPWHVQSVLGLSEEARWYDAEDRDRAAELERWTRPGKDTSDRPVDGVPEYAFGPRQRVGGAVVRDFWAGRIVADGGTADFEAAPQLALLGTADDTPVAWLRSGQALQRVLLLATCHDLAAGLSSQALERGELRWAARDPISAMQHVQMVLRLGYGPMGARSPRRAVRDVLTIHQA
ncbi:nitroreductase family protein [Streptomyces sp. TLI_146]|uniref:Acg family FMN-binding oxidoreductase n=1 Tax=Streptomyces sp. TLI_146 TaxID=1938858 RepID=UPI00214BA568|nr:nitroreductase family protein [Streptomyces sp. TLI_146]